MDQQNVAVIGWHQHIFAAPRRGSKMTPDKPFIERFW